MLNPLSRRKLTREDYFIIVSNLVPVFGAWFLGWSAIEVFIVYALETLIVGVITVLKLFIATLYRGKDNWYNNGQTTRVSGLFFILFFVLHFGLFAAVQTAIFSNAAGLVPRGGGLFHFFLHWYDYINRDVAWMLLAFVISYLARDLIPFVLRQDYKKYSMMWLMFRPYGRIIIQQFTVIIGSMFLSFGLGKIFILVFALVKIFFEVWLNTEKLVDRAMSAAEKKSGQ